MFKTVITADDGPVVLLADVKTYGEYQSTDQDDELTALIAEASVWIKKYLNIPVLDEAWKLTYDRNELSNKLELQGLNVTSIESYKVIQENGTENTVTSDKYRLSNGFIIFDTATSAGVVDGNSSRFYDAVEISVNAGLGDEIANLPDDFKLAMYMLVTHWQQNNIIDFDNQYQITPPNFRKIIMPYVNRKSWVG